MIFLLELAKKIVQLEQLVHCLPVFKESSSVFFHFFSYIVTLKILNLWTLQTLSYSHNTWFGNKIKCTTKVRINYITAWSFLGTSRCTTWNYCILLLNSLTVSRVNSKLNKRLKYVGIYLNLWNWILSPYERVPKKLQCQDCLCTLCNKGTYFCTILNTKKKDGWKDCQYYIALKGFLRKYPTWLRQMNCWFVLFNCLVYACEPKGEFDIWSWFTSKSLIPFHLVYHVCSLIFAILKKYKIKDFAKHT